MTTRGWAAAEVLGLSLWAGLPAQARVPLGVSPGGVEYAQASASTCPTFSWTSAEPTVEIELVVFEAVTARELTSAASRSIQPTLAITLPAGSTSWTPDAARCLADGLYGWSVRLRGSMEWSLPLLFEIDDEGSVDLIAAARTVRAYLEDGGSLESLLQRAAELEATDTATAAAEDPGSGLPVAEALDGSLPPASQGDEGIVAPSYEYSTARVYRHRVSGAQFLVFGGVDSFSRVGDYTYKSEAGVLGHVLYAPINVPQGALMTALHCYHYDNDSDDSVIFTTQIRRRALGATSFDILAEVVNDTSGAGGAIFVVSDTSVLEPNVDNFLYSYYFFLDFDHDFGSGDLLTNVRYYGCNIEYELIEPSSN